MTKQDNNLQEFVEQLLEEKGVDYLEVEVKEKLTQNLVQRAEDQIKAAIVSEIPGKKLEDFEEVLKSEDQAKVQEFVNTNFHDVKSVVSTALLRFRNAYLGAK